MSFANVRVPFPMRCSHCKGLKYIGEPYHAFSSWHVDVTCLICGRSKDIEISKLKRHLKVLERAYAANK